MTEKSNPISIQEKISKKKQKINILYLDQIQDIGFTLTEKKTLDTFFFILVGILIVK